MGSGLRLVLLSKVMGLSAIQALGSWQLVLVAVFCLSLTVQLFFSLFFFLRLVLYRPSPGKMNKEPVSIIICAWNEEENLQKNLPTILEQDHPDFEVIVVNDHSQDGTASLLRELEKEHSHLRSIELDGTNMKMCGKKFAISMGIKGSKHENLLFTDADCRPKSKRWLGQMTAGFSEGKEVILGYGGFEKRDGWFNKLYRYEGLHTAMQYFSYALAGSPYMGVGRNLAYRKELFFKTKGFMKHRHISSGDDDLLVNEVATAANTAIVIQQEAHTVSAPKTDMTSWWRQKRRHLTTGGHYRPSSKFFLGTYSLSHILFYLCFFTVLSIETMYWAALCGILLRWAVHLLVISRVTRILDEHDLLLFSLLGDAFSPFFNATAAIANLIRPPNRWR